MGEMIEKEKNTRNWKIFSEMFFGQKKKKNSRAIPVWRLREIFVGKKEK